MENNRPVNMSRVKKIYESMSNEGLLVNPIVVNKRMEIIDGQHRYHASKMSGNRYVIVLQVNNYGEKEVIRSNTNSASWSRRDFLEFYVSKGTS